MRDNECRGGATRNSYYLPNELTALFTPKVLELSNETVGQEPIMNKSVIAVVFLLLSQPALAQEREESTIDLPPYINRIEGGENKYAIPFTYSLMAQLDVFASKERERLGSGVDYFITIYRADPSEARTFVEELLSAIDEEATDQQGAAARFCGRPYTSADAYAGAMMMSDTRTEATMARIVLHLYERTSPELWASIAKMANDARSGTSMITTDHFEWVKHQDYREALAVQCPETD